MPMPHSSYRCPDAPSFEAARHLPMPEARAHAAPLLHWSGYGSESWEPEVAAAAAFRKPEVMRKPRPKSADICHRQKVPPDLLSRRRSLADPVAQKPARSTQTEIEAPPEKIAGDQWLQSLEKRIERVAKLAPGSLQAALALARPPVTPRGPEVEAPARPERPGSAARPTSAMRPSSAARPSSAMRTSGHPVSRPQSATLLEGAKARRTHQVRQQQAGQLELRVSGQPALRGASGEYKLGMRRDGSHFDEEWQQLGVPDLGSECSEEDSVRAAWLAPPSPFHQGIQKHQVSPVSSTTSLASPSR